MKTSTRFAFALSSAMLISAPLSTPAFAYADGPDYYRVVNVTGGQTLNLRARPGRFSNVVNKIPFNARKLGNRIEFKGQWTRIEYKGQTGWVHSKFIAEDSHNGGTIYKVVNTNSWDQLNMRKRPKISSRIVGDIPGSAQYVEECGACKGLWCPVRFNKVDGWVHKKFLAVINYPRDNRYSNNTITPDRRQDFRDRYSNEYMGLGNKGRGSFGNRDRSRQYDRRSNQRYDRRFNRRLDRRLNRKWFWFD